MSSETVERMLPLYQGMMVDFYDHRAADVVHSPTAAKRQNQPRYLTDAEHEDPERLAQPHYWVREELLPSSLDDWLLAFADVTSVTNERTLVPTAIPRVGVNHKLPLMNVEHDADARTRLLACASSHVVDYLARQKVGGNSMTYFYVRQFPILPPATFDRASPWRPDVTVGTWIDRRVVRLVHTAVDMAAFARAAGYDGQPYLWEPAVRSRIRAELDAAFFHLYGIGRDDVDYIMETFPIVKRKDVAAHGDYRTKLMILDIYDRMADAMAGGVPYESPFDADDNGGNDAG